MSLVSKRFYALMTTQHAWRMAFLRYFPAHTVLEKKLNKGTGLFDDGVSDEIRSEARFFARLTPLATWRSEYLFRTRLIRSLERGKPGNGIGASIRTNSKKISAVLTYNSKLPWLVTNIHASFNNGKKPPRTIQGAADLGVGSLSDPTNGKIERWGLEDPFSFAQLDEVMPNIVPYGLGDDPAAAPNVLDVSQQYGLLGGEGFPGGRAFFRPITEGRGRYLATMTGVADAHPDIPNVPETTGGISSVWLAKSSAVPAVTSAMVGILTGSTHGVVTAYALGCDSSGHPYANGDITSRWVLSPGVPIISIKVDDHYSQRRRLAGRVWAVALNALGEVFYLTEPPTGTQSASKGEDMVRNAWVAGRTAHWHLLESTRRSPQPDELDRNAVRGTYSPRSPSNSMNLGQEQLVAEAREIEQYMRYKPSYFRMVSEGWDMRRRLEVDFAADDGEDAGECVFVLDCAMAQGRPAHIARYVRSKVSYQQDPEEEKTAVTSPSLFGPVDTKPAMGTDSTEPKSSKPAQPTPWSPAENPTANVFEWSYHTLVLGKAHAGAAITASALDNSSQSTTTLPEDPLHFGSEPVNPGASHPREIPGRRARYIVIGTKAGAVLIWNARDVGKGSEVQPVRIIQTESPEISCVAASALYVVHGGSDGLVQAWDPLASTTDAIRTLNARSAGRVPRHMATMNPALREGNYSAAGAIYLDPDPTMLRGVVSFGAFVRYWAYSSASHHAGRKRRLRHSDIHGRLASRRQGGTNSRYIAAEEAELRMESEQRAREQARLAKRFGVGVLGDLTEEEALQYIQMVSEETHQLEEQMRTSDSTIDGSLDTASSLSEAAGTVTPEPGLVAAGSSSTVHEESDYEQQIQQAIRLSLMEGVNDMGQSPVGNSSGEYEIAFKVKPKSKKGKKTGSNSSGSASAFHPPMVAPRTDSCSQIAGSSTNQDLKDMAARSTTEDEDLALALSLSLQDQEQITSQITGRSHDQQDEYPPLETEGVGKGKGIRRW